MGSKVSLIIPSMVNMASMALDAPIAWPSCDLFADTGGIFLLKILRKASASTLSPTFVDVACALTASMSAGCNPLLAIVSSIHLCTVVKLGETKWLASEVIDHPVISIFDFSPCAPANSSVAKIMQPAPSETTKPRLLTEKGRLVFSGRSSGCPSFGR